MDSGKTPTELFVPVEGNDILEQTLERINASVEVKTLWRVMNVNAIERLGMSDHGQVHFQIVANSALRILRILRKHNVEASITKNFGLDFRYAEVVVFLASVCHDLGMSISRDGHEEFSLFVTNGILHKLLDFLDEEKRTIVISETLHAIISHRAGGKPLTIEAGIVRVADSLDMTKGRARISYDAGLVDIHSVSANAIERVEIREGKEVPIEIEIVMTNPAGIFQVDELMGSKLLRSGVEKFIKVRIYLNQQESQNLFKEYEN